MEKRDVQQREVQHKIQKTTAVVRIMMKDHHMLLPRENLRSQGNHLHPETMHQERHQQPRQQRHHANHQATDPTQGEATDRKDTASHHAERSHHAAGHGNAKSHREGKNHIDHRNTAHRRRRSTKSRRRRTKGGEDG